MLVARLGMGGDAQGFRHLIQRVGRQAHPLGMSGRAGSVGDLDRPFRQDFCGDIGEAKLGNFASADDMCTNRLGFDAAGAQDLFIPGGLVGEDAGDARVKNAVCDLFRREKERQGDDHFVARQPRQIKHGPQCRIVQRQPQRMGGEGVQQRANLLDGASQFAITESMFFADQGQHIRLLRALPCQRRDKGGLHFFLGDAFAAFYRHDLGLLFVIAPPVGLFFKRQALFVHVT